jgi:hypothetical protein
MARKKKTQAGDRQPVKLTPELGKFVENVSRYFESYGISRIGGRILGLLLVAPRPLSAEDISELLKVSRASVSTNIRFALQVGLAEKATFLGDRITYYEFPQSGLEKAMGSEVLAISAMQRFVEQGLSAVPPDSEAFHRLEMLQDWAVFLVQVWQDAAVSWQERQRQRPSKKK